MLVNILPSPSNLAQPLPNTPCYTFLMAFQAHDQRYALFFSNTSSYSPAMPFAPSTPVIPRTILAIDSALERLSLGLQHQGQLVGSVYKDCGRQSNEQMFSALQGLFQRANLVPQQVDLLVTTLGPGSFTGLRVGMAAALSYAQLGDVPVIGVDSMRLLAAQVDPSRQQGFYVLLNCVRQEVHMARYQWRAGELRIQGDIRLLSLPQARLEIGKAPVVFHRLSYGNLPPLNQPCLPLCHSSPNASVLISQGLALYEANNTSSHAAASPSPALHFKPLAPLYFQSSTWRTWKPDKPMGTHAKESSSKKP